MEIGFRMNKILSNWWNDLKLFAICMGILMSFRLAMLFYFFQERTSDSVYYIFTALQRSLLFDIRIACFTVLPSFILGIFLYSRYLDLFRKIVAIIFSFVTIVVCVINFGFFWEYHDQFNHWIYGMLYDDPIAILKTVYLSFPIIKISIAVLFVIVAVLKIISVVFRNNRLFHLKLYVSIPVFLLGLILFIIGLRGSIASRPLQRDDIGVTPDLFLNKLVANPYFALYYTRSEHKQLNKAEGLSKFLSDGELEAFLNSAESVSEFTKRTVVSNSPESKPKHIFLVVLESQDSWPLLKEYEHLNLTPNLKNFANSGIWLKNFISAGTSTRTSLNAIISGLPDAGVYTNYQARSKQEIYETALARAFQAIGYKVNLFYGGYLSWQRLGEFAKEQGFDDVYGREHMPKDTPAGSWGVLDEHLFDFILATVDPEVPSVNLIMTTSNHSPYPVDVEALGFNSKIKSSATEPKILGHQWYNDLCAGKFVAAAESKFENPVFVFTGDHTSRRFFSHTPSLYEQKSVPLIIYGKSLEGLNIKENTVGSHLNIVPTLIEWLSEKSHHYNALAEPLQFRPKFAFGADVVVTPESIFSVESVLDENTREGIEGYNKFHAMGWWRIMKGDGLR